MLHKQDWLVETIKQAEGRGGYDGEFYHPYPSAEGGAPTIGYGHKVTERYVQLRGQKVDLLNTPLTEDMARALLEQDIQVAELKARRQYTQAGNPAGKQWSELSTTEKSIFTEIAFNVGSLNDDKGKFGWPKLARAMKQGDKQGILAEIDRSYKPQGKEELVPDTRRNRLLRKTYKEQLNKPQVSPENLKNFMASEAVQKLPEQQKAQLFIKLYGKMKEEIGAVQEAIPKEIIDRLTFQEEREQAQPEPEKPTNKPAKLEEGMFEQDGEIYEVMRVKNEANTDESSDQAAPSRGDQPPT